MYTGKTVYKSEDLNWLSGLLLQRARPIAHFLFWMAVLSFYTLYFGFRQDSYGQSFLFVGLLLPITIATTYFLLYWLIPRFLLKQRYFYFGLYFLYTLVFSLYLELMLVLTLFINVANYQAMFVKPGLVDLLDVIVGMYLVVFLAVAINLLKRWLSMQAANAALENAHMETELKLKDAELQLLKSQIHPHFLFNTLNNLYALTLEKSDLVPDVVLQISQQLDYMLHRSNGKRVTVQEELNHIRNYLKLQSLRYPQDSVNVSLKFDGDLQNHQIAPLLLIPFVENSFKHGINKSKGPGWVSIDLSIQGHDLLFRIGNSINKQPARKPPDVRAEPSGIGLNNVRRRLALLYPDAHLLDIQETKDAYVVHLTLQLDESKN